jgi:hypothetical protein
MSHPLWQEYERRPGRYVEDFLFPNLIHLPSLSRTLTCTTCGGESVSFTIDGPTCLPCYWDHWPRPADVEEMLQVLKISSP